MWADYWRLVSGSVTGIQCVGVFLTICTGHKYGYVTPDRCADIIDSLVTNGAPVCDLWRGQMGVDPDEHKRLVTENGEGSQKPAEPRQPAVAQGLRRRVGAAEQAADGMQGCGEGCACVGKQGQE